MASMVCTDCVYSFVYEPKNALIIASAIAVALFCFIMLKWGKASQRTKIYLIYAHIFAIIFPFVYYAFNSTCAASSSFFFCKNAQQFIYIIILTLLSSITIGYLLTPKLLHLSKSKEVRHPFLSRFIENISKKYDIKKSSLHLVDSAKPFAFSISTIKAHIFISIGLAELLTRKEMESVLLHELGHIKNRTSFLKFSSLLHKAISPFSHFATLNKELGMEEKKADDFAVSAQGTGRFLKSAKRKVEVFEGAYLS